MNLRGAGTNQSGGFGLGREEWNMEGHYIVIRDSKIDQMNCNHTKIMAEPKVKCVPFVMDGEPHILSSNERVLKLDKISRKQQDRVKGQHGY